MDLDIQEFYVTFGVQFSKHPGADVHPLGMLKEGYAVIEAPDMDIARKIAHAIFGTAWAFIRDKEEFIDGGMAAKWHPDGELLRIAWWVPSKMDKYTRMMVTRVNEAEEEADRLTQMLRDADGIADALEANWESGDLSGAVTDAIFYLRGLS